MRRLIPVPASLAVTLCSAASSLPDPPVVCAQVPSTWFSASNVGSEKVVAQFDLDIWSTGSLNLTGADFLGAIQRVEAITDVVITSVTNATDTLTKVAHDLLTGDGPMQISSTLTLPAGITAGTDYYVIKTGADTFKLASSLANALAGTPIDLTTDGSGVITLAHNSSTARVHWHSYGALPATIALSNQRGFSVRIEHRPQVIAYAIVGTLSAGVVYASIIPVIEAP